MSTNPFVLMQQALINNPDLAVAATFTPAATGSTPQTINGTLKKPPLLEDEDPRDGAVVVYMFVRWGDITPNPRVGDYITFNGFTYQIDMSPEVDRAAGATIRLRRYA